MSANPEAFDAMRAIAYEHVDRLGKNETNLLVAVRQAMHSYRNLVASQQISEREADNIVRAVVRWTLKKYNPPRPRPKRDRQERAFIRMNASLFQELAGEDFGKSTIRNAARHAELTKSTVHRHLVSHGVAPRRNAKIEKMCSSARELAAILDATFDQITFGVMKIDAVACAMWPSAVKPLPRSTISSRRSTIKMAVLEVIKSGIGYDISIQNRDMVISRGRRFKTQFEPLVRLEELRRYGAGFVTPERRKVKTLEREYFWADPWVRDVIAIMKMSTEDHFYPPQRLDPVLRFKRPLLLDPRPLYPWFERAHWCSRGTDMGDNLGFLAEKIWDPVTRKAAFDISLTIQKLSAYNRYNPVCFDALQNVDIVLGIFDQTAKIAPRSHARLLYLRQWLWDRPGEPQTFGEMEAELDGMLGHEKSGDWVGPDETWFTVHTPAQSLYEMEDVED